MRRVQLCVVLDFPPEIHLFEHVQGRLLPRTTQARTSLRLDAADQLPSALASTEPERFAVIACGNDLGLAVPDQTCKGERLRRDAQHSARRRIRTTGVHDGDATVVAGEREGVTARGERHGVNPPCRVVEVFAADGVEGEPFAPDAGLGTLVDALDETREHAGMRVRGPGREQDAVRVPRQCRHGAPDRLLQVLRHPPVVFFLKVAHRDQAGA